MSKKSKIILSLIIVILSFNFILPQNIITSWHYDKVQMYEIEYMDEILSGINITNIKFEDIEQEEIIISNIKITSLQHSLYDSYLNFKTGLLLFSPDKISLNFIFNYTSKEDSGFATFDLKINMLKIRLKNNKEKQEQSATLQGYFTSEGINVYDIGDKELKDNIKQILYKAFEEKDYINKQIFSEINIIEFYKNKYSNNPDFIFETSSVLDKKEIKIKLNRFIYFCEDVEGKIQKALNYYSGEIGELEDKTDKSSVPLKNEKFLNSTDTYNMFINKNLINIITQYVIEEGIEEKIYDKNNAKKGLSYDFTFSSLKKYFSGLDKDDNLEFSTKIKISTLDPEKINFNVKFIAENEEIFNLNVEFNLVLNFSLSNNVRINLCLSNINYVKTSVSPGPVTISDEDGLKSAIKESFDFENNPLCLSDDGISLRDYYSIIHKLESTKEGYYIEGDQLYQ